MKKLMLSTLILLFSSSAFAIGAEEDRPEVKSLYLFLGAGLGHTWLDTDVAADNGDKNGSVTNFSLNATYYHRSWAASLGLGYYDLSLENDPGPNFIKLITETFYLDFSPEFRIDNRWSVGLSYQHLIGEELISGPTTQVNSNNEFTTQSLAGVTVHYDIPFKMFRIRTGLSLHKALSVGSRDHYIGLLNIELGLPIYRKKDKPRVVVQYRDREIVKTVVSEVLVFGEQLINFKLDSHDLNKDSESLLKKIAYLFKTHNTSWDMVRVVGHTDVRGGAKYNQALSERRAESVKNIFVQSGIGRDRIFSLGFGEKRPKDTRMTEEAHRTNRRVELHFIGHLSKDFIDKVKNLIKIEETKIVIEDSVEETVKEENTEKEDE